MWCTLIRVYLFACENLSRIIIFILMYRNAWLSENNRPTVYHIVRDKDIDKEICASSLFFCFIYKNKTFVLRLWSVVNRRHLNLKWAFRIKEGVRTREIDIQGEFKPYIKLNERWSVVAWEKKVSVSNVFVCIDDQLIEILNGIWLLFSIRLKEKKTRK